MYISVKYKVIILNNVNFIRIPKKNHIFVTLERECYAKCIEYSPLSK
ncbi:hypothetical protein EZS27_014706 [termite gut metagenome]|uniref:Uncharacterized protein n=1 Tax=termite gut metagenome TaxID=433724 RepID=A0A5J4RUS5_9ZZZZ